MRELLLLLLALPLLAQIDPNDRTRYSARGTGATAGARIVNVAATCPSAGCLIDSGGEESSPAISSDIFSGITKSITWRLSAATWSITANMTVPVNVTIEAGSGAILCPAAGKTLTINGPILADDSQHFCDGVNGGANGTVLINDGTALTAWFGDKGDGSHDDAPAIRATVAAAKDIRFSSTSGVHLLNSFDSVTAATMNWITRLSAQQKITCESGTTLKVANGLLFGAAATATMRGGLFYAEQRDGLVLDGTGCTIDMNGPNNLTPNVSACNGVTGQCPAYVFYLHGGNHGLIRGWTILDAPSNNIVYWQGAIASGLVMDDLRVEDVFVRDGGTTLPGNTYGQDFTAFYSEGTHFTVKNAVVTSSTFPRNDGAAGVECHASFCTVENSYFEKMGPNVNLVSNLSGVVTDLKVVNNTFVDALWGVGTCASTLTSNYQRVEIANNTATLHRNPENLFAVARFFGQNRPDTGAFAGPCAGSQVLVGLSITGNEISSAEAGSVVYSVTGATNANPVKLTLLSAPPTGTSVTISGATGSWVPINGTFASTRVDGTHLTIPVDSTLFGALTGTVVLSYHYNNSTCMYLSAVYGGNIAHNVCRNMGVDGINFLGSSFGVNNVDVYDNTLLDWGEQGNTAYAVNFDINCPTSAPWIANHVYANGDSVIDGANHWQKVTAPGTSQTPGPPTWNDVGGNTTDGTVTWTDQGVYGGAPKCAFALPSGSTYNATNILIQGNHEIQDTGVATAKGEFYDWTAGTTEAAIKSHWNTIAVVTPGNEISFGTNATTVSVICAANGHAWVGIGFCPPGTTLDVRDTEGDITSALNSKGILSLQDSQPMAQNVGAAITLGGNFLAAGGFANYAGIRGGKALAVNGDASGYMSFYTPPATGILTEKLRILSNGDVNITTGALTFAGTSVITSGRILQNVTGSASQWTSGTLPDAQLSANVPLLNAANVFTANQTIQKSAATLTVDATDNSGTSALALKSTDNLGADAERVSLFSSYTAATLRATTSIPFIFQTNSSEFLRGDTSQNTLVKNFLQLGSVAFASLGTPANGYVIYCTNCNTPATPGAACATGGDNAGAEAHRIRGAWACF